MSSLEAKELYVVSGPMRLNQVPLYFVAVQMQLDL